MKDFIFRAFKKHPIWSIVGLFFLCGLILLPFQPSNDTASTQSTTATSPTLPTANNVPLQSPTLAPTNTPISTVIVKKTNQYNTRDFVIGLNEAFKLGLDKKTPINGEENYISDTNIPLFQVIGKDENIPSNFSASIPEFNTLSTKQQNQFAQIMGVMNNELDNPQGVKERFAKDVVDTIEDNFYSSPYQIGIKKINFDKNVTILGINFIKK